MPFHRGQSLTLSVDSLTSNGQGIARMDHFVFFVNGGIPGQTIRGTVRRLKKTYGEVTIDEIVEESPHRVKPPCPYFGSCGGCRYQNISYPVQVESKTLQVVDAVERIGGIHPGYVLPTLPSEAELGYRNKMEFTFSDRRWFINTSDPGDPRFALGLHVPGFFDKVLDIEACLLQSPRMNTVFRRVKEAVVNTGLPPYSIRSHTGYWRFLVLREGRNTDTLMVNLITSSQEGESGDRTIRKIAEAVCGDRNITTFIHSKTDRKGQVAFAESADTLVGPGTISETIGDSLFEISPDAFFQTHTAQTLRLFQTIADLAELRGNETVYDLYCGTGAIGLYLAHRTERIIGIEVIESAIRDAKRNRLLNRCDNIEFILADMKDALQEPEALTDIPAPPDVIILDPPRGGPHPKTIDALLRIRSPVIVYVSCNPAILARDLSILCKSVYEPERIQPVDMFPQTPHVEAVARLVRR